MSNKEINKEKGDLLHGTGMLGEEAKKALQPIFGVQA
jgi:hypothetical protein